MADDPTEVRDWIQFVIYVLCTVIQTVVGSIVVFWWNRRNRKQDQKEAKRNNDEEKRKEDEKKQRADAQKVIAILSENYEGAVEKFRVLKKHIDILKNKKITTRSLATGSRPFTEFDVLLYMCHGDNWHKFVNHSDQSLLSTTPINQTYQPLPSTTRINQTYQPLLQSKRIGYGREEVMQDVQEIMKLFKDFAFQLPTIYRGCPDKVKTLFSPKIKEMGIIIYPFVTEIRQELIEEVLMYFGCIRLPGEQNSNLPGGENPLLSDADRQANGLIPYPGHDAIKDAIRYVEYLRYENDEMKYNIECPHSNITNLEAYVKIREDRIMHQEEDIQQKIGELLDGQVPVGDLLHVIRIVMLKIKEGYFASPERTEKLNTFRGYVRHIDSGQVSRQARALQCQRNLDRVKLCINDLEGVHKAVLRSSDTPTSLDSIATDLEELIGRHIN